MPNLIEVQEASYDQFLMVDEPQGGRRMRGFKPFSNRYFRSRIFPALRCSSSFPTNSRHRSSTSRSAVRRDLTYAAPLKVTLRLIVFDIDEDTGAKSIKDIKEQNVYMGDMPLIDGQRYLHRQRHGAVIVSQMHRSPGVFFDHDKGKSHSSASCSSPRA